MMKKVDTNYKLKIKKGDTVMVISGNGKGKSGRILSLLKEKDRAIVEGVNIITKHSKPTQDNPDGGIIKKEASVHMSNLMLIDPKTSEPTRIGRKLNDKEKLVRYSKKSGEVIDK
ncbi:MAG: 50S ribosomal protein L24 [Bacteroidetes bacterium]|jgi:large subunit ribosomal protein L24|nr:50S ribosomal protein L24 [Bacteroidota bacterium]MBT5527909.1 50S ribosomal protein L24 [Cytophagia bacterium]MBT3424926.1 50S ribosomal protein L24 [Bacteroidota bacterium]MBT3933964.1 50S ribosomal protein L24 [Bacteroidota bacterium]MBT4338247.1 50S ribosomal protein L24 [Bacteroidota bacterium]